MTTACVDCGHWKTSWSERYQAILCDFCERWPTRQRRPDLYRGLSFEGLIQWMEAKQITQGDNR